MQSSKNADSFVCEALDLEKGKAELKFSKRFSPERNGSEWIQILLRFDLDIIVPFKSCCELEVKDFFDFFLWNYFLHSAPENSSSYLETV